MNSLQKKRLKQKQIETISDEERTEVHRILNEFISKNRKKHLRILNRRLKFVLGENIDIETVEDTLQNIYVYMYLSPDKVKDFYSTGYLDRMFNSLAYHIFTLTNASHNMQKDLPLLDNMDFIYEEDEHWTTDNLNHELSNEERLEGHRIALNELKSYLMDNPQSNLKKALELMKNESTLSAYKVALNFVATPNYKFLNENKEKLGLKNLQYSITKFKKICSEVYGKEPMLNAQFPWKNF